MQETPWPKKGDKAFASIARSKSFNLVGIQWPIFPLKLEAFKIAAEMVIEKCDGADRFRYRDELFFPVAFLYRHGIELLLKDIIYSGVHMSFFKRPEVEKALASHNLAKLWNHAQKLLKHRWEGSDPTPLKAVEAVINEFHQADPNGQVFRYDEDKEGSSYGYETLPNRISLEEMRKTMEGVFSFLETTSGGLRDDLSNMLSD